MTLPRYIDETATPARWQCTAPATGEVLVAHGRGIEGGRVLTAAARSAGTYSAVFLVALVPVSRQR